MNLQVKQKYLNYFVGASGTGKTTLINFINNEPDLLFNYKAKEVSARPFLPKTGSYDQTLTDEIQAIIIQNRTLSTLEDVLNITPYGQRMVYSRSPIDNLAYQRVLNKGLFMNDTVIREIKLIQPHANFFYLPIEFPLVSNDEVRGLNEEVRQATDKAIKDIFEEFSISRYIIDGSIEERQQKLLTILK